MIIRRATSGAISFTIDPHVAVGKLAASSMASTLKEVTLALRNGITFGGKNYALTLNPAKNPALTNTVTAQACGQPSCVTLRPAAAVSSATVHLPKIVTRHGAAVGHVRLSLFDRRATRDRAIRSLCRVSPRMGWSRHAARQPSVPTGRS